jgi:hypothetical protein
MTPSITHTLNPLHVYCRLRSLMPITPAKKITAVYENLIFGLLYNKTLSKEGGEKKDETDKRNRI